MMQKLDIKTVRYGAAKDKPPRFGPFDSLTLFFIFSPFLKE